MPLDNDASALNARDVDDGDDDDDGFLLNGLKTKGLGRPSAEVDRSQHKHFVKYVLGLDSSLSPSMCCCLMVFMRLSLIFRLTLLMNAHISKFYNTRSAT